MAREIKFVPAGDDLRREASTKRTRLTQRSRWTNGLTVYIVGYGWAYDEVSHPNPTVEDLRPVLHTQLENGTPFDDLHLSTLVRPVMDVNGVENVPSGTFNAICQRKYADEALTTDEAVMLAILREASNNPNGTQFRVKVTISRKKTVHRLGRDGSQFISTLVEVNLG